MDIEKILKKDAPQKFPSGVIKFRNIEEAQAHWLAWMRKINASEIN